MTWSLGFSYLTDGCSNDHEKDGEKNCHIWNLENYVIICFF